VAMRPHGEAVMLRSKAKRRGRGSDEWKWKDDDGGAMVEWWGWSDGGSWAAAKRRERPSMVCARTDHSSKFRTERRYWRRL